MTGLPGDTLRKVLPVRLGFVGGFRLHRFRVAEGEWTGLARAGGGSAWSPPG